MCWGNIMLRVEIYYCIKESSSGATAIDVVLNLHYVNLSQQRRFSKLREKIPHTATFVLLLTFVTIVGPIQSRCQQKEAVAGNFSLFKRNRRNALLG